MNFRSDNTAPAHEQVLAALSGVNQGAASAYGEDEWSRRLDASFSALFARPARVFTVATGTAANAIALAALTPPWGAVFCHREAHVAVDECGAPEFYSGGAKLLLLEGVGAKLAPEALGEAVARQSRGVHSVRPSAVSIAQASERGAVYRPAELAALSECARGLGLRMHMDGARFANAVAALECAPGEAALGVDILSFGATKNGALAAEAVIAFDEALCEEIERRRKRAGQLYSKGRYAAAQLLAYLEEDIWLRLARRANALARRLGEAAGRHLSLPVETNQVFLKPGVEALSRLRAGGAQFYDWGPGEARLVVSWNQAEAEVDAMAGLLRALD